jgi:predicted TPR repeat methyltransferase
MVNTQWMKRNGIFAFGVDHYLENENCYEWSEKVGTRMAMHSEQDWRNMVENVGFEVLRMFRAASSDDRVGTLSFICRKL